MGGGGECVRCDGSFYCGQYIKNAVNIQKRMYKIHKSEC